MTSETVDINHVRQDPDLQQLWTLLPHARLVGGCVRDMLLGLTTHDIDLATPEPPDRVSEILSAAGIRVVETGLRHGTVTAVLRRRHYEITTLRRDLETDGRHAVVAWTGSWQEDAARRDFTINAMSYDATGELHDYFNGRADLAARRVRFVGDPELRLHEDALRLLRYFRFEARYGAGSPDRDAMTAVRKCAPLVRTLSAERVGAELFRILASDQISVALTLMRDTGVLAQILPAAHPDGVARLVQVGAPCDALLRLAALCPDENPASQLKRPARDGAVIAFLHNVERPPVPSDTDDDLRRHLSCAPADRWILRTWLDQARASDQFSAEAWHGLRKRLSTMRAPEFPLMGRDLLENGFAAGAELGVILQATLSWWREGGCVADKEACLAYVVANWGLPPSDVSS